jgi:hypothetical protein
VFALKSTDPGALFQTLTGYDRNSTEYENEMKQVYEVIDCAAVFADITLDMPPEDELEFQKKIVHCESICPTLSATGTCPFFTPMRYFHEVKAIRASARPLSQKRAAVKALYHDRILTTDWNLLKRVIDQRFPLVNFDGKTCAYSPNIPSHLEYLRSAQSNRVHRSCETQLSYQEYNQYSIGRALVDHRCTAVATAYSKKWKFDPATFQIRFRKRIHFSL